AAHLARCEDCTCTAQQLEDGRTWLQSFSAPEFSDDSLSQLRQSIRREVESQKEAADRLAWLKIYWRPAILATAVVLIAAALVFPFWNRRPERLAKTGNPPPVEVEKNPVKEQDESLAKVNAQPRRRNHRVAHRVETPAESQPALTLASHVQPADSSMV